MTASPPLSRCSPSLRDEVDWGEGVDECDAAVDGVEEAEYDEDEPVDRDTRDTAAGRVREATEEEEAEVAEC